MSPAALEMIERKMAQRCIERVGEKWDWIDDSGHLLLLMI